MRNGLTPRRQPSEVLREWADVAIRNRHWVEIALIGLLFVVALLMRASTLDQPLLEAHDFRQTQTALTARIFNEDGIDLLHPRLPVLGDSGEVPFEFPLFQALASIPMAHGVSADTSMRATGLSFFMLTGLLLWGLTRRLAGSVAAILAVTAFLFSPLNLLWSRTSLIEYLATAGALAWAWAAISWRDRQRGWTVAIAVASGTIAMLVKPTTAIFWVLPIIAHRPPGEVGRNWRQWFRARRTPLFACIVLVPVVVAALWTRHADAIKERQPATQWLTSRELTSWNFGTIDQRRDLANWNVIADRVTDLAVGFPLLALAVVCVLALLHPRRAVIGAVIASAVLTVAVFFNLYLVHDYYLVAITPQLAIVLGCAVVAVASIAREIGSRVLLAIVVLLWLVYLPQDQASYWKAMYNDNPDVGGQLHLAAELVATTRPDDRVVFEGFTWSPVVPYYAHRTGIMLTPQIIVPRILDRLPEQQYNAVLSWSYGPATADVLSRWQWISSPTPHVYYLGARPDELRQARLLATRDATAADRTGKRPPLASRQTIPCNGSDVVAIPTGSNWTWLRLEADELQQGVFVDEAKAAVVPARPVVVVAPGTVRPNDSIHLRCIGEESVTLAYAVDGPAPTDLTP